MNATIRYGFKTWLGWAYIQETKYANGALAIQLRARDGEPLATLSVNMPGKSEKLPPDCFYAKDWSENEEIAMDAMESGLFRLRRDLPSAASDFVVADVWQLVRPINGG